MSRGKLLSGPSLLVVATALGAAVLLPHAQAQASDGVAAAAAVTTPTDARIAPVEAAAARHTATRARVAAQRAALTAYRGRCTITGTPGDDVLRGTRGRDVICGRGGDDVIIGRGGADVVYGDGGKDRLVGGGGADVVAGGGKADDLDGGGGRDLLAGGGGGDDVDGAGGGDTLTGGGGTDALAGGASNDDLDGGPGPDDVDGDGGTNWCTIDPADTRTRCVYDRQAPIVRSLQVTPTTVDVSDGRGHFTVRMRLTDDTGITSVQLGAGANGPATVVVAPGRLVSGDVRDGWWEANGSIPQWALPGTVQVDAYVHDRVGRSNSGGPSDVLTVTDRNPDGTPPAVAAVALSSSTGSFPVDVRSAGATVTVTARLTDTTSGLSSAPLCLDHPAEGASYAQQGACYELRRVSGSDRDGQWRATVTLPKSSLSGDWDLRLRLTDNAGNSVTYVGPHEYAWLESQGLAGGLQPAATATFPVLGVTDEVAPSVTKLRILTPSVDTLRKGANVVIEVSANDPDGLGIQGVGLTASDVETGYEPSGAAAEGTLVSGSRHSGVWRVVLKLPQGTPPGRYVIDQVWLTDIRHFASYATPLSRFADQFPVLTPTQLANGDGTFTVVDNG